MGGFNTLPNAVNQNATLAPILASQTAFCNEAWSDETALGIVLADVDAGLSFEMSKNISTQFDVADNLVRGYVRVQNWPNSPIPRAALSMPVVLEAIEKLMPAVHMGIWGSGKDPFLVTPVGKTKPEAADARQHLLRWAVKKSEFKEGTRLTLKTCLTYGFCAGLYGWKTEKVTPRKYRKTADGKVERNSDTEQIEITYPTFEAGNLRNLIIDPACATQDARKGRFFAKRITVTAYDLDAMREDDTYRDPETGLSKIPTRDELRETLSNNQEPTVDSMAGVRGNTMRENQRISETDAVSKDPLAQPLELIEYVTQERVVTVLQRVIVIRNEPSDDYLSLPIVSCAFIDVLNSAYGFGVARLLGGEQQLQTGVVNAWLDGLALQLNPSFQTLKQMGAGSQNVSIAPGKVSTVDAELKPLITPSVSMEAGNAISSSEARASRRVGANGGSAMPDPAFRTGSGVQAFQGDVTQRLQYFLEIFLNLVVVPTLEAFLTMCVDKLSPAQIQEILSEEDGKAYEGDILDIYNADTKIEIISGVKLTTRQAAAQVAPLLVQLLSNEAVQDSLTLQGKKFDYARYFKEYLELMGWDTNELIVDMEQADFARMQAQQEQAAQAMKMQAAAQQHDFDVDSIDAKASAQAGLAVVKANLKHAEQSAMNDLTAQATSGQ
jgi:hypothetical protein